MTPVSEDSKTIDLIRLLATTWLLEPDTHLLNQLKTFDIWPAGEGLSPDDAALEYSQLILQQIPPYASLFLSEDGMLNGPHVEQVQLDYLGYGFEIRPEWRAGTADHLGVELHFLAFLLERRSDFWLEFLNTRMLNWIPVCCQAIERNRHAQLYAAVAASTLDTLPMLFQPKYCS